MDPNVKTDAALAPVANTYPITGLWCRTVGGGETPQRVQVLVEHGGAWKLAIDEHTAGEIGHIVEVGGLERLRAIPTPVGLPTDENASFETARSANEHPINA